jgi:hypothetical protein
LRLLVEVEELDEERRLGVRVRVRVREHMGQVAAKLASERVDPGGSVETREGWVLLEEGVDEAYLRDLDVGQSIEREELRRLGELSASGGKVVL